MVSAEVADDARPHGGPAELYERHAPAAGRLAYLLTGSHEQAEDLVQEAFVRVVGGSGTCACRTPSPRTCAGRS